ncbi:MAG TPA: SDR family oxidoreductase [Acidimicrobiales bacterium]|nr:SDR family oxidoreductase [Acidimicrobiales bacterium]
MDLGIAGKIAFVSGGSMGMGRATAELFATEGCRVAVAALEQHKDSIDETVAAITASGGHAIGVAADLTVKDDVCRAVAETTAAFGPPDIAVANVGGPKSGYLFDVTDEDFMVSHQQMTMSMVYLCREVVPHMRRRGWGRIVNLNSISAKEPFRELAHILANTARAAVVALNKSLSNEFAGDGVTINTIGIGYIGTDRMLAYFDRVAQEKNLPADAVQASLTSSIPAGRVGLPSEMAGTVAFLCSEYGGFINGELIAVDGGQHRCAW